MGWQTTHAVSSVTVATVPGELFPQACGTRLWILAWDTGPAGRASPGQSCAAVQSWGAVVSSHWLHAAAAG